MTALGRRDALRIGGLCLGVGALAAACSSDDDRAPEAADGEETATDAPDQASVDASLLNTALSLEVLIFDTYQVGFDFALAQSEEILGAMALLQQHHAEHRATLTALVEASDAEPFTTANPVVKAALVDPTLAAVTAEGDFVRLVHDLERACAQLYVHVATVVGSIDVRTTVLSIAAVASRRATVLDLLGDLGNERVAAYAATNPLPSDAIVPV